MTEATATGTAAGLAQMIKACQGQTEKYIENCPEDRRYAQLAEGKATPLWLMGHMANTIDLIGIQIGFGLPSAMPESAKGKFNPTEFGGGPITTNPDDYPSWDETAEAYIKVLDQYAEAVAQLSDEELAGPPKGTLPDMLKDMIPTLLAGVTLNIIHDSHHRGQVGMLSKLG